MNSSKSEILIIGSGFGGSIAAERLAAAGLNVTLLERGPWRDTVPVRSMGIVDRSPLPQGFNLITHGVRSIRAGMFNQEGLVVNTRGFFEAFIGNGMALFCTSNVGGGSHAYAGLHTRPINKGFWDGKHPEVSSERMSGYYDEIIGKFGSRPVFERDHVPNHVSGYGGGHALDNRDQQDPHVGILLPEVPGNPKKVLTKYGVERWECAMDNNSFLGSPTGAKTTLDFAFLWPAIKNGLKLKDLCEVKSIHEISSHAENMRYEVKYRDHKSGKDRVHLAKHVIVAAGGINTVRLLLKSRDVSRGLRGMPNLGKGIGGNGDYFGFWKENAANDLSRGLPVGGGFKARESKYESAYFVRAGLQGIDSYPLPKGIKNWLRRQSILIGLGNDEANGSTYFKGRSYLMSYERDKNPGYAEIDKWVAEIEGGTSTKVYAFNTPISVHPIGGARLGSSVNTGVVDANGEVYGHEGLYVADSSSFACAPGGPPSMTISVWSANVADKLINKILGQR